MKITVTQSHRALMMARYSKQTLFCGLRTEHITGTELFLYSSKMVGKNTLSQVIKKS
jgi:hypothetical protein